MKGSLVAAYNVGHTVFLWFSSPTGDSSDSHQFSIRCNDSLEAELLSERHRITWGIPDYGNEEVLL